MVEPQHVAIQAEPDIEAPQENALPHPNQALQSQQRPALARQLAEQFKNGTAQLADGVTRAVNTVKDNPKLVAGLVATGTLATTTALLAGHYLMHSAGSSASPHHAVTRDYGFGGNYGGNYGSPYDNNLPPPGPYGGAYVTGDPEAHAGGTNWGPIVGIFAGLASLGGLAAAYFMCRPARGGDES